MKITNVQVTKITKLPYGVLNVLVHSPEKKKTYSTYHLLKSIQCHALVHHETLLPEERNFLELAKTYSLTIKQVDGIVCEVSIERQEEWEQFEKVIGDTFSTNATAYSLDDSTLLVLLEVPHTLLRIYWSLFESMMDVGQQQEDLSA